MHKGGVQIIKMEFLDGFFHEGRGGLEFHIPILKKWFFKKLFRIIPWLWKRVLHLVWALYYVYVVANVQIQLMYTLAS